MTQLPAVRFGVFGDAHYAKKIYGNRHCEDSAAKLAECVATFQHARVDFSVCLGDLIDSAADPVMEAGYARTMAAVMAGYAGPWHIVLGNHDVNAFTKARFLKLCAAGHPPWYSFEVNGIHFMVLDGNHLADGRDYEEGNFSWDEAWLSAAQLDWMTADLASVPDRPTVILCHENLAQKPPRDDADPHVLRDAPRARALLEGADMVTGVVQAHYHEGMEMERNGITYIGVRAMVIGPGLENNAFAVVSVSADGGLTVDGYGQQRDYTLHEGA